MAPWNSLRTEWIAGTYSRGLVYVHSVLPQVAKELRREGASNSPLTSPQRHAMIRAIAGTERANLSFTKADGDLFPKGIGDYFIGLPQEGEQTS